MIPTMVAQGIVIGKYLESVWVMCGLCLNSVRSVFGILCEFLYEIMHEMCMESVLVMYICCVGSV